MATSRYPVLRRLRQLLALAATCAFAFGATPATRSFNLPAGDAAATLKQFSAQAEVQVLFPPEQVENVRTNAVSGDFSPVQALEKMLAGTALTVVRDDTTGALGVRRPPTAPPKASRAARAKTSDRPVQSAANTGETIELTPFEVKADASDTYQATNTNSLAGINTSLSKIPVTAEILNRTLLDDLGAENLYRVLGDFMGLGAPAISTNELGRGGINGDDYSSAGLRSRGLSTSSARDSLGLAEIAGIDGYSVERVEVVRGPQSLLYGPGEPGGVVNYISKKSIFGSKRGTVKLTVDDEGSKRGEIDANVGTDKFALRVNGLLEDNETWRENIGRTQKGVLVSLGARPVKALTLRADYQWHRSENINGSINYGATYQKPASTPADDLSGKNLTLLVAQGLAGDLANGILNFSTVDSVFGNANYRDRDARSYAFSAESVVNDWLSVQVRFAHDELTSDLGLALNNTGLRGPTDPANLATGHWAVAFSPGRRTIITGLDTGRALVNLKFPLGRWAANTLVLGSDLQRSAVTSTDFRYYRTDGAGNIIRNPAQLTSASAGRTELPAQWVPIDTGSFAGPYRRGQASLSAQDGFIYQIAPFQIEGGGAVNADNPLGLNGGAPSNISRSVVQPRSGQAVLLSDWFGGRLDTLLGVRKNEYRFSRQPFSNETQRYSGLTKNLGAVWHVRKHIGIYYGYSDSNNLPSNTSPDFYNETPGLSLGTAQEAGLKLDLFEGRLSGSITGYTTEQRNATMNVGSRDTFDPPGINGRFSKAFRPSLKFDVKTEGAEAAITARPVNGMNVRVSYSLQRGVTSTTAIFPYLYNDEFNTMIFQGVNVVAVKTNGVLTPLDPPGAATTLPVANLTNPSSPQFAILQNNGSGLISNASALGLTTPGVGTGRVGLPISAHQLGFVPPGGSTFTALQAGDRTVGYPEQTFALALSYRVQSGRLKNLGFGVNGSYQPNFAQFYVSDAARGRYIYYRSDLVNTGGFVNYDFKLGRKFRLKSQLNVANLFDQQKVDIRPNTNNGRISLAAVLFTPRLFTWSNTVSF